MKVTRKLASPPLPPPVDSSSTTLDGGWTSLMTSSAVAWMLQDSELIITVEERWLLMNRPPAARPQLSDKVGDSSVKAGSFTALAEIVGAEETSSSAFSPSRWCSGRCWWVAGSRSPPWLLWLVGEGSGRISSPGTKNEKLNNLKCPRWSSVGLWPRGHGFDSFESAATISIQPVALTVVRC